ncbi:MAG: hypothetical protein A2Z25_09295 [Planctomycetes bacterium RBG_16_55_9]|nr:MAG: hypothetical protein A2Z25_09295 [Planctomycetes bacterium RBG_16_55_9]
MKMVKRTLIAIALVAFLAGTAPAAITVHYFGFDPETDSRSGIDKDTGVKVDGNEKVFWPYEYKAVDVCLIPVKMEIGMYVEVQDCTDKKIVLKQVPCADISKGTGDFPCHNGCVSFAARANFDVKFGTRLEKIGNVIDQWEGYYDGDDVIPGDGADHTLKVCVKTWKSRLWTQGAGEEVDVGRLYVTAKPDV